MNIKNLKSILRCVECQKKDADLLRLDSSFCKKKLISFRAEIEEYLSFGYEEYREYFNQINESLKFYESKGH